MMPHTGKCITTHSSAKHYDSILLIYILGDHISVFVTIKHAVNLLVSRQYKIVHSCTQKE